MKRLHFDVSKGILATATAALALAAVLAMSLPSAFAADTLPGLFDDNPAILLCSTTVTGTHTGAINVASGTTCLDNLKQTGAVNVSAGAALWVRNQSVITGAVTLVGASAFAFCDSSTVGGAIKASTGSGFAIIGNGGDKGLLARPCGANHIDGAVTLNGNLGGVEVGGNSIVGALTVSGNIGPGGGNPTENNGTEIEANTVKGLTTCATNNPAPTNDGHKNTFTGGANGQCAGL